MFVDLMLFDFILLIMHRSVLCFTADALLKLWRHEGLRGLYKVSLILDGNELLLVLATK